MEEQRACPKCRALYGPEVLFCPKDGAPLVKPAQASADEDPYLALEVASQFRIEELIGVGAMGRVYRAHQRGIERQVAIKILHRDLMRNPSMAARLEREAKVASRLTHPNVVQILMTGQLERSRPDVGGETYLVMEFLDGLSLRSALAASGGSLPLPRALHVVLQVCDAVGEAHASGIVHRDLKPENVMLVRRGEDPDHAKVLDFGVARMACADATVATQAGVIFGTARYISPEGAQGETVSARSDVYSLATLLFECLAGTTPFDGDSPVAILIKHTNEPAPALRSIARANYVPEPIARVVQDNLSKDPKQRAPDARELGRALVDAARRSGLHPADLVIRSSLLGERPPLTLTSLERTRSLGLSAELEAKLKGETPAPSRVTPDPANAPGSSALAQPSSTDADIPSKATPSAALPSPAEPLGHPEERRPIRPSPVELTLSDEPVQAEHASASGWRPAPQRSPDGSSSLASIAGQVVFPDATWEPPPAETPLLSRRWPLAILCFAIGSTIALLVGLRLGVFSGRSPKVEAYVERASVALESGAWDAPPGENVKDITDAALIRFPGQPDILAVRRQAAKRLLAKALEFHAQKPTEALRWALLALEFDPSLEAAKALIARLPSSAAPPAASPPPPDVPPQFDRPEGPLRPREGTGEHASPLPLPPSPSVSEPPADAEPVPSAGRWL